MVRSHRFRMLAQCIQAAHHAEQRVCRGCTRVLDTHCLFSAVFAALKSLKYCVMAFAASLCSLIVGPLFAGLCDS